MVAASSREGNEKTLISVSEIKARRLTVADYVVERVAAYRNINVADVTDDLQLGSDSYRVAADLEDIAEFKKGTLQDAVAERDMTVGDLIKLGIAAYVATQPRSEREWHYPLPG